MSPFAMLVDSAVALIEIRTKNDIGSTVSATPIERLGASARAHLVTAFEALHAIKVGYGRPGFLICEREGVTLRMTAMGLVHNVPEAKAIVDETHWTDAPTASIAVNGHTWTWSEMVDGVIAALKGAFDLAFGEPPVKRKAGQRKSSYADEPTAKLLKTAKTLIRVNYGGHEPSEVVRAKLAEAGVNPGPVTVAAVVSMLEQMAETCRRAAFPRIDEAIARLEGTGEVEATP